MIFNEVLLNGIPFFLVDQHYIAQIDYRTKRLAEYEYGVFPIDSVGKQYQAPDDTEVPKSVRHYALTFLFGRDPLQDETQRKADLTQQPESDPEIKDIKLHSSSHL